MRILRNAILRRAASAAGAFATAFLAAGALRLLSGWCGPVAAAAIRPAAVLAPLWLYVFAITLGMRALARKRGFAARLVFRALLVPLGFTAACGLAAVLLSPDHLAAAADFIAGNSSATTIPEHFTIGAESILSQTIHAFRGECVPFADSPTWLSARWAGFSLKLVRTYAEWSWLLTASVLLLAGLHVSLSAVLAAFAPVRDRRRAVHRAVLFAAPSAAGALLSFLPAPSEDNPRIFEHIACKDSTYGGSAQLSATNIAGHVVAWCADVPAGEDGDFKGRVMTVDGRPAIAGTRFFHTRALNALLPVAELAGVSPLWDAAARMDANAPSPAALLAGTRMEAVGVDSCAFMDIWRTAGLKPAFVPDLHDAARGGQKLDLLFVSPEPDWISGAARPSRGFWERAKNALSTDGVCAYRIDARLVTTGRMKALVEDFASAFPAFRVWCAGANDWILAAHASGAERPFRFANLTALCSAPGASAIFLKCAGPAPEAGVLGAFAGAYADISPAFARVESKSALESSLDAPFAAFESEPGSSRGEMMCGQLIPSDLPSMAWCEYSADDPEMPAPVAGKIANFLKARRSALRGLQKLAAGKEDEAGDAFAEAAKTNPCDAVLRGRRDLMAIQCLQMLRKPGTRDKMRAFKTLENLAYIFPSDAAWQYNLGRYFLSFGGKADIAAQLFQRAADLADVKLNPEYREAHAQTLFNAGQYKEAEKSYLRLAYAFPRNPRYLMLLARVLAAAKNPGRNEEQALKLARKAVELAGPDDESITMQYADMLIDDCNRPGEGLAIKRDFRARKNK